MRVKHRARRLGIFGAFIVAPIAVSAWSALDGCGNDSFGVTGPDAASDATSDASTSDATADVVVVTPFDGGACDLSKPFQPFTAIAELIAPNVQRQTARLTHDELNIYFQQQPILDGGFSVADAGDGGADAGLGPVFQLMTASRARIGAPWGTPAPVGGLTNPPAAETDPSVAPDNDTLYFGSSMSGSKGASDLWESTRLMPTTSFGTPTTVSGLDTINDESQPYLMPNGLALYFRTKPATGGNFDLAYATRETTTPFVLDTSNIFQNVNTANLEALATVTFDELTLYFTSDRAEAGAGGRQIYKATRASKSDPFGAPVEVTELNTLPFVEPSWISDDGCRLYLTSNNAGSFQLNIASKPAN